MSTLLIKVHTDFKKKFVFMLLVTSTTLSFSGGRLIVPKQATMKGKTHSMSLPKLFHTTPFFSLFCFLQRSWIRKHFIGVFRSMPCLMDITAPYRPKTTAGRHSWCLTSKMQTIIYCTESTYGYWTLTEAKALEFQTGLRTHRGGRNSKTFKDSSGCMGVDLRFPSQYIALRRSERTHIPDIPLWPISRSV